MTEVRSYVRRTGPVHHHYRRPSGKIKKTKGPAPWVKDEEGLFVGRDDDGKPPYPKDTHEVGFDTTPNRRDRKGMVWGRSEGSTYRTKYVGR